MWLQSLKIKHFRNYQEADIDFHPGLNVFLGQNAQGKTNILEAVYFLALTRSHRTRSDKDLIHFTENDLLVSGILEKKTGKVPLDINLTPKGRITKVNHLKQSKLSDYIGTMNVVLFAPEDLQLIKGSPSLRRKFIDIELGQIKPVYLSDLSNYNHVLKQRNAYLKANDKVDETFLSKTLEEQNVYVMSNSYELNYETNTAVLTYKVNVKPRSSYTSLFTAIRKNSYITQIKILA